MQDFVLRAFACPFLIAWNTKPFHCHTHPINYRFSNISAWYGFYRHFSSVQTLSWWTRNCKEYYIYVLIDAQGMRARDLGACLKFSTIKSVIPYLQQWYGIYTHTHIQRINLDFCLQGSGDLRNCCSQTEENIAWILVLPADILMSYQAFAVNLSFNRCGMLL